jgi:hypothetical protein
MSLSALLPVACLALSEVESETGDASLGGAAGFGGISYDGWVEAASGAGGSAGSDGDAPPATTFPARGVVFDGLDDWLERAGVFNGVADSTQVSGSIWFKRVGTGTLYCVGPEGDGSGAPNQMEWMASDHFRVSWRRAGGGVACDFVTKTPITDTMSWHHIAFSVDTNDVTKTRLYVDGAANLEGGYDVSGYDMDHTGSQWGLFSDNNGAYKYDGEVAELWLSLDHYLDFGESAVMAKFRNADGKPADLGASGEVPTGAPPAIYLSLREGDPASFFATNRGTGGDFTLHGTLELSSTSPGD